MPIRRCEIACVRGDRQVTRAHERHAEPRDCAVNACDDHVRHPLQVLDGRVDAANHPGEMNLTLRHRSVKLLGKRLDVAAGHEVRARAPKHDATQTVVRGELRRMRNQCIAHGEVERIER